MAMRFQVTLAHQGCDHTGSVVWEERNGTAGAARPIVVSLPRGFVSMTTEDGSVEIVCTGCAQTVASAAQSDDARDEGKADSDADEDSSGQGPNTAASTVLNANLPVAADVALPEEKSAAPPMADQLEALFAEHPDVPPIPGDAIPPYLLDRLRHLAGRLREQTN
jgi:hypothetical protein